VDAAAQHSAGKSTHQHRQPSDFGWAVGEFDKNHDHSSRISLAKAEWNCKIAVGCRYPAAAIARFGSSPGTRDAGKQHYDQEQAEQNTAIAAHGQPFLREQDGGRWRHYVTSYRESHLAIRARQDITR
jgi:hypothetical protein